MFYIPGVYLEWPSDPWEHFRRITEWATLDLVGSHSAGYKSLYFFAYSFLGRIPVGRQLFWLNIYYTGMCLLLAWQYYLLAKAVGLSHRWAFLSVIVNVLTFGNVCFSFYRYYGLASTILAQIGAVALTRVAILAVRRAKWRRVESLGFVRQQERSDCRERSLGKMRSTLMLLLPCSVLLALIAFNHVQGLGIVGLSIASVVVWRLIEWKHSTMFFLIGGAVALSAAAILWWPRDPLIGSEYRPIGWLNVWYGFNLFAWPSPAADRGYADPWALRDSQSRRGTRSASEKPRDRLAHSWPANCPWPSLCGDSFLRRPCQEWRTYLRFSSIVVRYPLGSIADLSSLLPQPMRGKFVLREAPILADPHQAFSRFASAPAWRQSRALVLIPSTGRSFNRLWNSLAIQADDLDMASIVKISGDQQFKANNHVDRILCAPGAGFVLLVNGVPNIYGCRSLD